MAFLPSLSGIGMTNLRPLVQTRQQSPSKIKFLALSITAACCTSMLTINSASAATNDLTEVPADSSAQPLSVNDFIKCTDLKVPSARLACYDKATVGEELPLGREKNTFRLGRYCQSNLQ